MRDDEKNLSMNYGPSVLSLKIIQTIVVCLELI